MGWITRSCSKRALPVTWWRQVCRPRGECSLLSAQVVPWTEPVAPRERCIETMHLSVRGLRFHVALRTGRPVRRPDRRLGVVHRQLVGATRASLVAGLLFAACGARVADSGGSVLAATASPATTSQALGPTPESSCRCTRRPGKDDFQCPKGADETIKSTIDAAGGKVQLHGQQGKASGVAFSLDFPPKAYAAPTVVRITETSMPPPADLVDFSPGVSRGSRHRSIFASEHRGAMGKPERQRRERALDICREFQHCDARTCSGQLCQRGLFAGECPEVRALLCRLSHRS